MDFQIDLFAEGQFAFYCVVVVVIVFVVAVVVVHVVVVVFVVVVATIRIGKFRCWAVGQFFSFGAIFKNGTL